MNTPFPRQAIAPLLALALGACSSLSGPMQPAMEKGGMLTNNAGMTLYTFDKDPADGSKSVCVAKCAENWPPLMAGADAKASAPWSLVKRDDGQLQYAYKGKPLYLWVKDQKPGDTTGDGVNGVWRIARP